MLSKRRNNRRGGGRGGMGERIGAADQLHAQAECMDAERRMGKEEEEAVPRWPAYR